MSTKPEEREPLSWSSTVLPRARAGDVQAIRDTLQLAAAVIRAGRPIVEPGLAEFIANGLGRLAAGDVDPFGAKRRRGEHADPKREWTTWRDVEITKFVLRRIEQGKQDKTKHRRGDDPIAEAADLAGVTYSVAKRAIDQNRKEVRSFIAAHPAYDKASDLTVFRRGPPRD